MTTAEEATRALTRGLRYLRGAQLAAGNFPLKALGEGTRQQASQSVTLACSAHILTALAKINNDMAGDVRRKLATWLLQHKQTNWSFGSGDLDTTFDALVALQQHDPAMIDESCLASLAHLLIAAETAVGGPYASQPSGRVSLVTNCQIAYFLQNLGSNLPKLAELMERAIAKQQFTDSRFVGLQAVQYFLARSYTGAEQERLHAELTRTPPSSPLVAAVQGLALLVSQSRNQAAQRAVTILLDSQQPEGSWAAEPFYQTATGVFGSQALTTALAVELLQSFLVRQPATSVCRPSAASSAHVQTAALARQTLGGLPAPLSQLATRALDQLARGDDNHEILLITYFFAQALRARPAALSDELCLKLGAANAFCWLAYTIYDDFIDDEGRPSLLPVANAAHRLMLQTYHAAFPDQPMFQEFVQETLDGMDAANAWEIAHCRFCVQAATITIGNLPQFERGERLSQRSFGHVLGPIGLLLASGVSFDSPQMHELLLLFKYYLIARQLNDDLLDWREDLRAGNITWVVATILAQARIPAGAQPLDTLMVKMEHYFWKASLPAIQARILRYTRMSRAAASRLELLSADNQFLQLIDHIENSVEQAQDHYNRAQKFLKAYTGVPFLD